MKIISLRKSENKIYSSKKLCILNFSTRFRIVAHKYTTNQFNETQMRLDWLEVAALGFDVQAGTPRAERLLEIPFGRRTSWFHPGHSSITPLEQDLPTTNKLLLHANELDFHITNRFIARFIITRHYLSLYRFQLVKI